MNFDLDKSTVFLVNAGSHAYGFATAESDHDYRGLAIAPMRCYIGLKDKFEHAVGKDIYTHFSVGLMKDDPRVKGSDSELTPDIQINELRKFVNLACQNNPSIIEILFTDESDYIKCHPIMEALLDNRDALLTKQVKARFCGYAFQQLKRIKNHKKWLDNPPTHQPTRSEFGLPERTIIGADHLGAAEALIQKELDEFMISQDFLSEDIKIELSSSLGKMMRAVWYSINPDKKYPIDDNGDLQSTHEAMKIGIAIGSGFSDNFVELLLKEKKYKASLNHWRQYQTWKKQRNPKRAAIEEKYGVDLKHATHLVRLIRMAKEILETGKVHVKRPDAEELLAIRNGAWSYEKIVEFAEDQDKKLEVSKINSKLPAKAPINKFDKIVQEMIINYQEVLNGKNC